MIFAIDGWLVWPAYDRTAIIPSLFRFSKISGTVLVTWPQKSIRLVHYYSKSYPLQIHRFEHTLVHLISWTRPLLSQTTLDCQALQLGLTSGVVDRLRSSHCPRCLSWHGFLMVCLCACPFSCLWLALPALAVLYFVSLLGTSVVGLLTHTGVTTHPLQSVFPYRYDNPLQSVFPPQTLPLIHHVHHAHVENLTGH